MPTDTAVSARSNVNPSVPSPESNKPALKNNVQAAQPTPPSGFQKFWTGLKPYLPYLGVTAGGLGLASTFFSKDKDKSPMSYLPWLALGALGGYGAYKGWGKQPTSASSSNKTVVKTASKPSFPYSVHYGKDGNTVRADPSPSERKFFADQLVRRIKRWGGVGLMGLGGLGALSTYLNPEEKDEEGNTKPSTFIDYLPSLIAGGAGAYSRFTTPPVDTAGLNKIRRALLNRTIDATRYESDRVGVNLRDFPFLFRSGETKL